MHSPRLLLTALVLFSLTACRPSRPDRAADRPAQQLLLTAEPAWFETPHDFDPKNGVGKIHQGGLNGLLDRHGKVMAPAKYRYLINDPDEDDSHGEYLSTDAFSFARPRIQDARWGLLLSDGTEVVPPVYGSVPRRLSEGLVAVSDGGKWHFFNLRGEEVFQASFDSVGVFFSGLAAVADGCDPNYGNIGCFNGKWGFMDEAGVRRGEGFPQWGCLGQPWLCQRTGLRGHRLQRRTLGDDRYTREDGAAVRLY
jgi:hypothetical protein